MVFNNNLLLGAAGAAGGYTIDQSIRFNSADSSYLSRTPSSNPTGGDASGAKQFTVSVWLKRGKLSVAQAVFAADASVNSAMAVQFAGASGSTLADQIDFDQESGGSPRDRMIPSALYRDVSAWYHLCLMVDTTQATAANRLKIAINGVLVSNWYTNDPPALNAYFQWNKNSVIQRIGSNSHNVGNLFDGYMAEFHNVDGVAAETSFGEFNNDGVWVPKAYTGTYGTNGFYITGEDSAALGTDYSGNGNDFTSSGLTSDDQVTDTPTNNHATLSPLIPTTSAGVFSNGNLSVYPVANVGFNQWFSTIGVSSGKWHVEAVCSRFGSSANGYAVGIASTLNGTANHASDSFGQLMYDSGSGNIVDATDGSVAFYAYGATFTVGDRITCEFDLDGNSIEFFKNGASQGTYTPDGDISNGDIYFAVCGDRTSVISVGYDWTFNADNFTDTPTTGFKALSTANLPAPDIRNPSLYFDIALYTGTSAVQSITDVNFSPEMLWIKNRSAVSNHIINDVVRGVTKYVFPSLTNAETTFVDAVTSFDSDGFTLGADTATTNGVNGAANTYVAWMWKANGTGVANTDGTISSTVSVNQTAGFSVVTATAGASGVYSYGHGLGVKPSMFIVKNLDAAQNWQIWNKNLTSETTSYLQFTTSAQLTFANMWGAAPTSTTFSMHTAGPVVAGDNFVAYCFAEVEGFSKFGSYTGNGSTDGPFVWCGFRPAFVIIKRTDGGTEDWQVQDSTRNSYNVIDDAIYANSSAAEVTNNSAFYRDFLSNGFKIRASHAGCNASSGTYIFMAFAENPFGGAGVAPATAR